ncbi:MAG: 4Fe-4S binding protein [Bacteroidales bacterium]
MNSKFFKNKNLYRLVLQWSVVFALLYMWARWAFDSLYTPNFEAYCPFGGLQAWGTYLVRGSLPCSMTTLQIFMGATLLVGTFLIGKLFCGYLCPLGTFSQWLGKLGDKIFKKRRNITGIADKALRAVKYILLFITLYFTLGQSELFCKNYDPFFATFTLFDRDVTVWMAFMSIALLVVGAMMYRMFWCKYLCPLGAITNIFRHFLMFIAVIGVYIILLKAGVKLSYVWPIAIIAVLGYVLEIWKMQSRIFPFMKVTRNESICTSCGKCSRACRHGIPVDELVKVNHIDCDLCLECVHTCPHEGALTVNRKRKIGWLPAVLAVLLIVLGIVFANKLRIPTIELRWADEAQFENARMYERTGLKSVKCYGSSMNFASHVRQVRGVLGVTAYADDHSVEIYYDPKILTPEKITEAIFSASAESLTEVPDSVKILQEVEFGIDHFFDQFDAKYLKYKLMQFGGVYGFDTRYGEPVSVRVYFSVDAKVNLDELKKAIEAKSLTYTVSDQEVNAVVNFEASGFKVNGTVEIDEYNKRLYPNYFRSFNNIERYNESNISILELPMEWTKNQQAYVALLQRHVQVLDSAVVAIQTYYRDENPAVKLYFVNTLTSAEKVKSLATVDSLRVLMKSGETKIYANPFHFIGEGVVTER